MLPKIDGDLRLWIEHAVDLEVDDYDPAIPEEQLVAEMLLRFERGGDAMRYVKDGAVAWKATMAFARHLRDLEADAVADLDDDA